ncbi:MAG: hypothetical protein WBA68_03790, partial [Alteraurantiacibacter sp.]
LDEERAWAGGSINDPASYSREGVGGGGGYYPRTLPDGSVSYVPCVEVILGRALANSAQIATGYATLADQPANPADGDLCYVYANNGDPADAGNGIYQGRASEWERADWYTEAVTDLLDNVAASIALDADRAEEAREATWKAISATREADALSFTSAPAEGSYPVVFASAYSATIPRLQAGVLAGGGSFDISVLVDGLPVFGPVTVGAAGVDVDPGVAVPLDAQVEILVADVVDTTNAFVQIERAPTEEGSIPAVSGPIGDSDFTLTAPGLAGRANAGAGPIEQVALGTGLSFIDGALVATGGGGGALGSHADSGSLIVNAVVAGNFATQAAAVGNIFLYPLLPLARAVDIIALEANVTAAAGGGLIRFGIYRSADGDPEGATLVCDSGELSTAAAGAISGAVAETLLPGNTYWIAVLASAAATLRAVPTAYTPAVGCDNLNSAQNANLRAVTGYGYHALPAVLPAANARTVSNHIAVGLRIA